MQVYGYELTMVKKGTLTIENLPFDAGEKVEVIIIPRSGRQPEAKQYPFWGKANHLLEPN